MSKIRAKRVNCPHPRPRHWHPGAAAAHPRWAATRHVSVLARAADSSVERGRNVAPGDDGHGRRVIRGRRVSAPVQGTGSTVARGRKVIPPCLKRQPRPLRRTWSVPRARVRGAGPTVARPACDAARLCTKGTPAAAYVVDACACMYEPLARVWGEVGTSCCGMTGAAAVRRRRVSAGVRGRCVVQPGCGATGTAAASYVVDACACVYEPLARVWKTR